MEKTPTCVLCNSSRFRTIHRKGRWSYRRCGGCGLVRLDPRPSSKDLKDHYHAAYLPRTDGEIAAWKTMMRPIVHESAEIIGAAWGSHTGRLLDIGSGFGFFLEEMKSRGWEVEGLELSETGRLYTKRMIPPVRVYAMPLETLDLPPARFDVITLFYVLEHLPDPPATLREVHRILKPGGRLLIRWPHTTPIVRLLGPLAGFLDLYHTPFHLYDFSFRTIRLLLKACSFKEVKTVVGGYTLPESRFYRYCSKLTGAFAETCFRLSKERVLLPGVSKTTTARKTF